MGDEQTHHSCSLCKCRFSSCALNKYEKNKNRPIEKNSVFIYTVIKNLQGDNDATGHTCTYCRDVLRSLDKKYKSIGYIFPPEFREKIKNGSVFPIRNLKRKGSSMSGRASKSGKSSKACSTPSKSTGSQSQLNSESDQEISSRHLEKVTSSPSQEEFFGAGGIVDSDEGFIRKAALIQSPSTIKRSQEHTTVSTPRSELKKRKLCESNDKIYPSTEMCTPPLPVANLGKPNILFSRLCKLHHKNKTPSIQSPFIIPEILTLWKISNQPSNPDFIFGQESAAMSQAVYNLTEFLNTGKCNTLEKAAVVQNLIENETVNDFVLGLLIIEIFREWKPEYGEPLKECTSFGTILPQFVSWKESKLPHERIVRDMYNCITLNGSRMDDGFALDSAPDFGSFQELKKFFYYWLYHQVSLSPELPVTEILFSSLELPSVETGGTVRLTFIDAGTGKASNVFIHSLVLMLLQNAEPTAFRNKLPMIKSAFSKLRMKRDHVLTLLKALYTSHPVADPLISPIMQLSPNVVADTLFALSIDEPLELFYKDFSPSTPYTLKLAMLFYERTHDLKYLFDIKSEPFKYLSLENATLIEPSELKSLFMLDEIAFNEKQLYDFIIKYCNIVGEKQEGMNKKLEIKLDTCNLLLPFVRYPLMSREELDQVSTDGFLSETEILIFLLYITAGIERNMPERFWRPTIPRQSNKK